MKPEEIPTMTEVAPQVPQRVYADLEALHRQMEEMATKTKRANNNEQKPRHEASGPVLVIRGK